MAQEEPAQADAGATEPAAPKSKLPLIAAIVAGIAVGAGSGVVVVGPMFAKKFAAAAAVAAADTSAEGASASAEGGKEGKDGKEGDKEGGKGGEKSAAPPILTLENLVLNPAGAGGAHYLLMTIAIECKDQTGVNTLTARDAELKDLILTTLAKKSVEQLDIALHEQIKTELIASLTERFGKGTVKQLYFPQFVIQ